MPIYEFKCSDCGEVFSELRKIGDFAPGACTKCSSMNTEKKMSSFATAAAGFSSAGPSCSSGGG